MELKLFFGQVIILNIIYVVYKLLFISNSVPEDGDTPVELDVHNFKGPGVALAMYNVDEVCSFYIFSVIAN